MQTGLHYSCVPKSRVYVLLCLFMFNTTPIADIKTTSDVLPAEMNGSGNPVGGHTPDNASIMSLLL